MTALSGDGLDDVRQLEERSYAVIEQLRRTVFAPDKRKKLNVRFNITKAAALVGRTANAIRDAERSGRLPPPAKNDKGRRIGYSLSDINTMRQTFGTVPWRGEDDDACVVAVQNFKGGVGKSTIAAHTAQYLALRGYRVAVIDCDPQGSTSSFFGVNPDYDLEEGDTLYPFLLSEADSLEYALLDTYWDQLKLIPANLSLYSAEYQLAARLTGNPRMLDRLRLGIDTIKAQFDVVIIDPPPALGMISLSVLQAADALVIPVRPATIDFGSTAHFFTLMREALEALLERGLAPRYKFLRILINDMDEGKSAHTEITAMMRQLFGVYMFDTAMRDSAEIDNAGGRLMTVYELTGPTTSRETHQRCKHYLDAANLELEILIRTTWPSHREALKKSGLI